jgi:hypothetical protein
VSRRLITSFEPYNSDTPKTILEIYYPVVDAITAKNAESAVNSCARSLAADTQNPQDGLNNFSLPRIKWKH